jgi:hypothetical protein
MNGSKQLNRLFAALGREGLDVSREGRVYRVRRKDGPEAPAEVLLPDDFPVEAKALRQLAGLMAVKHPCGRRGGARVCLAGLPPGGRRGGDRVGRR